MKIKLTSVRVAEAAAELHKLSVSEDSLTKRTRALFLCHLGLMDMSGDLGLVEISGLSISTSSTEGVLNMMGWSSSSVPSDISLASDSSEICEHVEVVRERSRKCRRSSWGEALITTSSRPRETVLALFLFFCYKEKKYQHLIEILLHIRNITEEMH